ncbi:MAG: RNA 2',3'-cyclic phosphodiesterase [Sphingomonadales bacterium]
MPRLFVGLELPEPIKQRLLLAQGGVIGARWQSVDQLHLTLRFIGDVDGRTADDVDAALTALRFSRFGLRLQGVGAFGRPGQPRVLWAGVEPRAPLLRLHNKIDHGLVKMGLPPEERRFDPHVTLARFGGRGGPIDAFLAANGDFAAGPFEIEYVSLFTSSLGRGGAHYDVVGRYPAKN